MIIGKKVESRKKVAEPPSIEKPPSIEHPPVISNGDNMKLSAYTDAGARGNPGPAAIAVLIFEGSRLVREHGEYIGTATNNQAEYQAVIKALELAHNLGANELRVFTDSELVCRQLKGNYKVKDRGLKPLHEQVKTLEKNFGKITWGSVPRENPFIKKADRIVNRVLDSRQRKN